MRHRFHCKYSQNIDNCKKWIKMTRMVILLLLIAQAYSQSPSYHDVETGDVMEDMAPEVEMEMGEDKVLEMMKILNKQGGLSPEVLKKHHVEDIVAGKVKDEIAEETEERRKKLKNWYNPVNHVFELGDSNWMASQDMCIYVRKEELPAENSTQASTQTSTVESTHVTTQTRTSTNTQTNSPTLDTIGGITRLRNGVSGHHKRKRRGEKVGQKLNEKLVHQTTPPGRRGLGGRKQVDPVEDRKSGGGKKVLRKSGSGRAPSWFLGTVSSKALTNNTP